MDSNRLFWDTPLVALYHSDAELGYVDLDEGEMLHFKYIKREKLPNGKYRYYYDEEALKADVKKKTDKVVDSTINKANSSAERLNKIVDNAKAALGRWYAGMDSIYDVSRYNYEKKVEQIKQTKEWRDIVARADPEYVKKNKDGSVTYKIDDYIVDKKHPVLDAISDIAAGQEVTLNRITRDTVVAGLKDYVTTGIEIGMMATTFLTNGLIKKFKFSQGSYDEDIAMLVDAVEKGAEYTNSIVDSASSATRTMESGDWTSVISTVGSTVGHDIDKTDVEKLASMLTTAQSVSRNVSEDNVVNAAKVLMESDVIKETVGANGYYKQAEQALSNLSEEEIMLINLLIQQLRGDDKS